MQYLPFLCLQGRVDTPAVNKSALWAYLPQELCNASNVGVEIGQGSTLQTDSTKLCKLSREVSLISFLLLKASSALNLIGIGMLEICTLQFKTAGI